MTQTDKQLAGNQRRTLRKIRQQLLTMSSEWDGRDNFSMSSLEDLADKVEVVATELVLDDEKGAST